MDNMDDSSMENCHSSSSSHPLTQDSDMTDIIPDGYAYAMPVGDDDLSNAISDNKPGHDFDNQISIRSWETGEEVRCGQSTAAVLCNNNYDLNCKSDDQQRPKTIQETLYAVTDMECSEIGDHDGSNGVRHLLQLNDVDVAHLCHNCQVKVPKNVVRASGTSQNCDSTRKIATQNYDSTDKITKQDDVKTSSSIEITIENPESIVNGHNGAKSDKTVDSPGVLSEFRIRIQMEEVGTKSDANQVIVNVPSEDMEMSPMTQLRDVSMGSANQSKVSQQNTSLAKSCFSNTSEAQFCRICHEGESRESLLSPCNCTGTMGLLHISCLEKWLGSTNTNICEICHFEYLVVRKPKSCREWLASPNMSHERRNLSCDIACFVVLTPLACVSSWLCLVGAHHYSSWHRRWEVPGLISLTAFLLSIFLIWCMVAVKYHIRVWTDWRQHNQIIQVLSYNKDVDPPPGGAPRVCQPPGGTPHLPCRPPGGTPHLPCRPPHNSNPPLLSQPGHLHHESSSHNHESTLHTDRPPFPPAHQPYPRRTCGICKSTPKYPANVDVNANSTCVNANSTYQTPSQNSGYAAEVLRSINLNRNSENSMLTLKSAIANNIVLNNNTLPKTVSNKVIMKKDDYENYKNGLVNSVFLKNGSANSVIMKNNARDSGSLNNHISPNCNAPTKCNSANCNSSLVSISNNSFIINLPDLYNNIVYGGSGTSANHRAASKSIMSALSDPYIKDTPQSPCDPNPCFKGTPQSNKSSLNLLNNSTQGKNLNLENSTNSVNNSIVMDIKELEGNFCASAASTPKRPTKTSTNLNISPLSQPFDDSSYLIINSPSQHLLKSPDSTTNSTIINISSPSREMLSLPGNANRSVEETRL